VTLGAAHAVLFVLGFQNRRSLNHQCFLAPPHIAKTPLGALFVKSDIPQANP